MRLTAALAAAAILASAAVAWAEVAKPGRVYFFAPDGEGGWRALESEWDGRYLVFGLPNGGSFAVTAAEARHDGLLWAAAGGAALLALVLGGRAIVRRKKGKTPPEAPGTTE